jgi:hypothetical protein
MEACKCAVCFFEPSFPVAFPRKEHVLSSSRWGSLRLFFQQLKCSDEKKDQSCMNCVIYGTKCQYTPPWSPTSGRKKDATSSSKQAPQGGAKKRSTSVVTGERGSQSPGAFDSQDSPNSSLHDEAFLPSSSQALLPKMVNARRLAVGMISPIRSEGSKLGFSLTIALRVPQEFKSVAGYGPSRSSTGPVCHFSHQLLRKPEESYRDSIG